LEKDNKSQITLRYKANKEKERTKEKEISYNNKYVLDIVFIKYINIIYTK